MVSYIFLALFIAVSLLHLYDSWRDNHKRRRYTKPLLLILLTLFYCFAAEKIDWVLVAALLFSWLGDVLLMPSGTKWFVSGGISFLISHILFIFVYSPHVVWQSVTWWIVIPLAAVYVALSVIVTMSVRKNLEKMMLVPMILYLVANSTMNLFALMLLTSTKTAGAAVAYVGAVSFFASDCTLYLVRYHQNKDLIFKKHFTVMFTYLLGEALITAGMLMIQ